MNVAAEGFFCPWVGGLLRGHIAMDVFSEEYFPCLGPTTVLVVVPDARLYILFTLKKRRKNEEIEAHSLHTSSLLDADLFPFRTSDFSTEQNRQAVFFFMPSPNYLNQIVQETGDDANCFRILRRQIASIVHNFTIIITAILAL